MLGEARRGDNPSVQNDFREGSDNDLADVGDFER